MASHTRTDWHRRAVLGGLAAAPFAAPAEAALDHVSFKVPDGACDCHHHIYDTRWAYAPTAVLKPPPPPRPIIAAIRRASAPAAASR